VAENLLQQDFTPAAPNRCWAGDIERHEAPWERAVMKGHRHRPVAAGR
jgi:hypothetical protein